MISHIAPATPAIPAEPSILGSLSSTDSTSSFADQLASAVSQAGSNPQTGGGTPTNISAAQSQNSDTPAASGSASSPVQYSFFQYLIDTPAASAASSALPSSAAATQPPAAADASIGDPSWLSPPYYTPPAPTFVTWENPPGVMNTTASPETDLQNLAAQFINDPTQFVWGAFLRLRRRIWCRTS